MGTLNGRVDDFGSRLDRLTDRVAGVELKTDANREAINAVGVRLAGFQAETREGLDALGHQIDANHQEATAQFRSLEEGHAEVKDLLVEALDRRDRGQPDQ